MNRFNYIGMLAYVALSMSSCDDSFDVSSKADGVLAVSQEGFNTLQSYNVGEKYTADLWIQQGYKLGRALRYHLQIMDFLLMRKLNAT